MTTTERSVPDFLAEVQLLRKEARELYLSGDNIVIAWSGGKDSTAALQLMWEAVSSLPVESRKRPIRVITNDTLVENPMVSAQVKNSLKRMQLAAEKQKIPLETHITHPSVKDTFWVNLIGRGYPAPRWGFRWCTERLKINPAEELLRKLVAADKQILLVLGVRKAESAARAASMEKQKEFQVGERLNANPISVGSRTYSPIESWTTREVWLYLMQCRSPWGDNKELLAMYRGATADSECPMVVDTSTPSCGSSRFGCFVCTMVDKDKSMEAMIQNDEEKEWMQPLLDIRNELDIRDEDGHHADHDRRDYRRATGRVQLYEARADDGGTYMKPIPGPYTKFWREYWLKRILEAQTQVRKAAPPEMRDITLITPEELSEIRYIWREQKHEFCDSLPCIYQEVTGEPFNDCRPTEAGVLGSDEWDVLEEVCSEGGANLELMAKLLNTERQYAFKVRRTGIYEDLNKHFETSSFSKRQAIANAHYNRELKLAIDALKGGDINTLERIKSLLNEEDNDLSSDGLLEDIEEDSVSLEAVKTLLTKGVEDNEPRQLSWAHLKLDNPLKNQVLVQSKNE